MGLVGILTGGLIDRSAYYTHALIMALIPFVPANQWLYSQEKPSATEEDATTTGTIANPVVVGPGEGEGGGASE